MRGDGKFLIIQERIVRKIVSSLALVGERAGRTELLKTYFALVINIPLRVVAHLHSHKLFRTNEGLGRAPTLTRPGQIRNHFVRRKVALNFVISELG